MRFSESSQRIPVHFKELQLVGTGSQLENYEGPYEVTPKITAQTLETKQKFMDKDIQIREIPYYRVSNIKGGDTVTIG